jgi:hypothetical protein
MNSIDILKQAELADKLGNFRLADSLYNRAIRTVVASGFDKALIESLEKAGIKAGETVTYDAIGRVLLNAIESALVKGEAAELRLLLKEAGVADDAIEQIVKDALENKKAMSPELFQNIAKQLEKNLNSSTSIFNRMKPNAIDKIKDVASKVKDSAKQRLESLMKNPGAKKKLLAAGIIGTVGAAGWYFVSVNGEPVSDEEVENALSASEMYDLRMQAKLPSGVSQQEFQGEKAQKFVTENKDKFTTQRDFYNAALGAGDKNFANSVIAIVKKDLSLPVESEKA